MTSEELKDTYNNRTISINGESLGKVVGIELDYDTVCFTFEDLTKKYITLNNLSQITIAFEKSIAEDMQYFNFIKDFNSDSTVIYVQYTYDPRHSELDNRIAEFKFREKLFFANNKHVKNNNTFSTTFKEKGYKQVIWNRKSEDLISTIWVKNSGEYNECFINIKKS